MRKTINQLEDQLVQEQLRSDHMQGILDVLLRILSCQPAELVAKVQDIYDRNKRLRYVAERDSERDSKEIQRLMRIILALIGQRSETAPVYENDHGISSCS